MTAGESPQQKPRPSPPLPPAPSAPFHDQRRRLSQFAWLRRYTPWLVGTAAVALAAIFLSVIGVRDVRRISASASTIAGDWLVRMDRLLAVGRALQAHRQGEAELALATDPDVRRRVRGTVDSLAGVIGQGIDGATAGLFDGDEQQVARALRETWARYLQEQTATETLAGGPGSPALAAFRTREATYRRVTFAHQQLQAATSARAARLARDSGVETRTVTAIVLTSAVLTLLLAFACMALIRSDRLRRRAEQRWQDVASTELGMIWEVDAEDRLVLVSEQLRKHLGRTRDDVLGRMPIELVPEVDRAAVQARFAPMRAGVPFTDFEVRFERPDGSLVDTVLAGVPVRDEAGQVTGFRGTAMDVTERRRTDAAIARAQRLDSLGTLAGGIAHDFNNILHAIGNYADLAGGTLPTGHPARRDLQQIRDAGARGKRLVERILTFSRARTRDLMPIQLADVIEEALVLVRPTLPSTVVLDWDPAARAPAVVADATELHQVVINLLANAVYAMRTTGGRLGVRLGRQTGADGACVATLTITDTGVGIPAGVLDRIYEPFFTTKPQTDGTGMGLAMVHGIVTALGGTIDAESTPGEGTTFLVRIPAHAGEAHDGLPTSPVEPSRDSLEGRRVLLVDDDPLVLEVMQRLMTRDGMTVQAFADPSAALSALTAESPPPFDLVVSDISMPSMTGLEMVARLREANAILPVILCTGYGGPDGADRAHALGVHAFLEKPVTARELRSAISSALAA